MTIKSNFDHFRVINAFQKEIVYFMAVAETLNISKASELLGIQQSGLSRALIRLESDLAQKLFMRKNNGLKLTAVGQQFLLAVKSTKNQWETALASMSEFNNSPPTLLKLGLNPSFGKKFLAGITLSITNEYPSIELEILTSSSFQITRKILEDELDFGIVASPIKQPEIVSKAISTDYLAAFQKDPLVSTKYFVFNPETQMSQHHLKKFSKLKKISIRDYELIAKTSIENNFIALLPHSVASEYPTLKQVSGKMTKAQISLISHKEKLRSKIYENIFQQIQRSITKN